MSLYTAAEDCTIPSLSSQIIAGHIAIGVSGGSNRVRLGYTFGIGVVVVVVPKVCILIRV